MNQALKTTRIDQFLDQPSATTFAQLQQSLQGSLSFESSINDLARLSKSLDDGDFEAVLTTSDTLFDRWCLSPRFHYLRGQAALQSGDEQTANEAKQLSHECLYWLCETGDGTFESPYLITYRSDQADILMAFNLEKRCQETVEGPKGRLDVVTLHDGIEIWFACPSG